MALEDIAGYSLRRKLGSGSAGPVWLVRDRASGRNAVVKRVPTTEISDPEEFREHLAVLQRIDHPHLARLQEIRETGTEWLLFSQYVVAGTLTALLGRRGPLTDGELVTLLSPLAEALDHLHRTGLTHGRVTPANIMFDADGRPVLTDAVLHTYHQHRTAPTAPSDDLTSLATVAQESGGDPAIFTPNLFATTHPHDLLALTTPVPINLAFTDEPTPTTAPARPRPTTKPATTDDPIERSRGPLTPTPPSPSPLETPQPTPRPKPPPPKPIRSATKPKPRKSFLPKLTRRTRPAPAPVNPLDRLTPAPTTPASTPAHAAIADRTATPTGRPATSDPATPPTEEAVTHAAMSIGATPSASSTSSAEEATSPSFGWGGGTPGFTRPPARSKRTTRRRRPWRRRNARWRRFRRPVRTTVKSHVPATRTPGSAPEPGTNTSAVGTNGGQRFGFRHPAYGVLAAVGLGAVVVLILGLITVGVLDNPAGTAAAADRTEQFPPPSPPSQATPSPTRTSTATPSPSSTTAAPRPTNAHPTAPPQPSRVDAAEWTRTLQALDAQRAQAFWTLDLALLDTVYVPGTKPWAADRALLATYLKHQIRVRGLQIRIDQTTIESQTPITVVLRVVDHLTAGQAINPTGTTTTLSPAVPTTRRITLTTTPTTTPRATPATTPRAPTSSWRITAIASV